MFNSCTKSLIQYHLQWFYFSEWNQTDTEVATEWDVSNKTLKYMVFAFRLVSGKTRKGTEGMVNRSLMGLQDTFGEG